MSKNSGYGNPASYTAGGLTLNDGDQVALQVDVNGKLLTSGSGGSGGVSVADKATGVPGTTAGTPAEGIYQTTPDTLTNNQVAIMAVDVNRNVKTREQFAPGYEDNTNNKAVVEIRGSGIAISTATTTTVKSAPGHLNNLRVIGGTLGNVTVYDNTAGSGTVLCPTVTPVANGLLLENIDFLTGLTVVTAAATVITGSYR